MNFHSFEGEQLLLEIILNPTMDFTRLNCNKIIDLSTNEIKSWRMVGQGCFIGIVSVAYL